MLELHTNITNGKLPPIQRERIAQYLRKLGSSQIHIYIDKKRKPKSEKQRGYYWACMLPHIFNFCQGTQFEFDTLYSIHEAMKTKFLTVVPQRLDGTLMEEKILSTEALNAKETEDYYEQIRRFWSTHGLYIPEPNEAEYPRLELT